MSEFVEQQCVGCALGGLYTALAIENILPILHAGAGCASNASQLLGINNGSQQGVGYNENMLPCTNLVEEDVIFGGMEKLKTLLHKTLSIFEPDMAVVLSGCVSAIIADDIDDLHNVPSEVPVVISEVAGFKGDNIWGHHRVLQSIIEQYLDGAQKEIDPLQVNVWGIIPYYDPFWAGNLEAIEKLLSDVGLKPNIIYGFGHGIKEVKKIPNAAFNLVLSPWWDLETVQLLEQKFQTPYLHYPLLPIGPTETRKFLLALKEYAHLDGNVVDRLIEREEKRFYYHIERSIAIFNEGKRFVKRFTGIATSAAALSAARFLVNDLGLIPEKLYIVDNVPEKYRTAILHEFADFEGGFHPEIEFLTDVEKAHQDLIRKTDELRQAGIPLGRQLIVGSSWEDVVAANIEANLMEISAPVNDRAIINKNFFGYDGGLRFFEELITETQLTKVS